MKHKLRKEILKKRDSLTKEEIKEKSKQIEKRLFSLPEFKNAKKILFYVSYRSEVNTHDMIKELLKKNVKKIVAPVVIDSSELELSRIEKFEDLEKGYKGILEPKKIIPLDKEKIDLMVVPGVVFDKKGNRVGYGKGFFDRLISKLKPSYKKVGLAFELQIVDYIATEKHDEPVDVIVTEKRIIVNAR